MRKLKKKYKWQNRQSHFLELERRKKVIELLRDSTMFKFSPIRQLNPCGILTTIIQNDLAGMPSSLVSALEKESVGTTIPTSKESFRTLGGLPITLDLGE